MSVLQRQGTAHMEPSKGEPESTGLSGESHRAEILIGWVNLGILSVFATLFALAPAAVDANDGPNVVWSFLAIHFLFTIYRIHRASHGQVPDRFIALCTIVDMVLLFSLIWSFHIQYNQPAAFYLKAPTFVYAFIFIALRALGFDMRWVALSGAMAVLCWLILVSFAVADDGVFTHSYVEYLTTNQILLGAEIDKMLVIAVMTTLLGTVVYRARVLLFRQVRAANQVHSLNTHLFNANKALEAEVAKREHYQTELERIAFVDGLTNLSNRAGLERRMAELIGTDSFAHYAVIALDIDGFRLVNTAAGYSVGDEVLRAIGHRLRAQLRPADALGRVGNDEFAAFVELAPGADTPNLAQASLDELCVRLSEAIAQPLGEFGGIGSLSGCIGTSAPRSGSADPHEVLRDAEIALERAKSRGAGTRLTYEAAWHAQSATRHQLETDLVRAVRDGDLELYYQPIVDAHNGLPRYFEALLRWRHPQLGFVSPTEFIPIAEATGLIHEIGNFALQTGMAQLNSWQQRIKSLDSIASLGISINVSNRQLDYADSLLEKIEMALQQYKPEPGTVYLEITESTLMNDPTCALETLQRISSLGPRLLLDDFGTGYSCLGLLPQLPLYGLKIDRSFVSAVETPSAGRELVKSILSIAARLELGVVAEGVETEVQRARLADLGCPLLQGYLFAKPMSANDATIWLDSILRSPTSATLQPLQRAG